MFQANLSDVVMSAHGRKEERSEDGQIKGENRQF